MRNSILQKLRDRNQKAQDARSMDIFLPRMFDVMKLMHVDYPEICNLIVQDGLLNIADMIMSGVYLENYFVRARDSIVEYCSMHDINIDDDALGEFDGLTHIDPAQR